MSTTSGAPTASDAIDPVSTLNIRTVERPERTDDGASFATDTEDVQKPVVALPRRWKGTVEEKARSIMVELENTSAGACRGRISGLIEGELQFLFNSIDQS